MCEHSNLKWFGSCNISSCIVPTCWPGCPHSQGTFTKEAPYAGEGEGEEGGEGEGGGLGEDEGVHGEAGLGQGRRVRVHAGEEVGHPGVRRSYYLLPFTHP